MKYPQGTFNNISNSQYGFIYSANFPKPNKEQDKDAIVTLTSDIV